MQPLLNFPTLRQAGMNNRDAEVLLERLDDIEDAQLTALKINPIRVAMAQKQVSRLVINVLR